MDVINLIISLISGAVGGNVGGAAVSEKNLGAIANTIIGLLGGGFGDFILKALGILASTSATGATTGSELDIGTILANIGVSGVSGGVLTAIIALIKDAIAKNKP
jgi:uncharacterized membrane protein YeaQ/YmgE (transglycosylase-associated protein family)